jgi:serine/alanine adding enzyme
MSISFHNTDSIKQEDIAYKDIYFTPEYGRACEYSDNAVWECCVYRDLIYVYLKKEYKWKGETYYELITPYGYSGYQYDDENTFKEFVKLFREEAKRRKYLTEVVRQNPYIGVNIESEYDLITKKGISGIEAKNAEDYLNERRASCKRKIKKAKEEGLRAETKELTKGTLQSERFRELYDFTMNKVRGTEYYMFNDEYFEQIESMEGTYIIIIYDKYDTIVGTSILFETEKFIHYHLSCNDSSVSNITDFLLYKVVEQKGIGKMVILGGGLTDKDSLHEFKKKFETKSFEYKIYKHVINKEVYNEIEEKFKEAKGFPCYRYC